MKKTDRFAKTIVFCEDQEEAEEMRRILSIFNPDLVKQYPDYICRVVSEEGELGRGHLGRFQELELTTPVILTTSRLLTTGIDMPTCKNIVLYKVINSMTDFKQIIGRGTRVRSDYGKLFFTILDYTGATRLFADPAFDGEPALLTQEEIDALGTVKEGSERVVVNEDSEEFEAADESGEEYTGTLLEEEERPKRKYYVDTGDRVEILVDYEQGLDEDGNKLKVVKYNDYTAEKGLMTDYCERNV